MNGHDVSAGLLLKAVGPDIVNVCDARGRWVASLKCCIFILRPLIYLLSMSYSYIVRTPLHSAAYSGNVAGLQLVIDQGAEVNSVDQRGCSALMVAAERGQTRAVGV